MSVLRDTHLKKLSNILVAIVAVWICKCPAAHGRQDTTGPWQTIESRFAVIYYLSEKDLQRFDRKIDYSPNAGHLKRLRSELAAHTPYAHLLAKVDAIFERVQEILDMRGRPAKVIIRIYGDKKAFDEVCFRITGKKCRIRSWYLFETRTVYANAKDIHEGILAHEMAHHIIDHYMTVRPPRATAEILARYVDKHLFY